MGRPKGTPEKLNAGVQEAICKCLELSIPEKYSAEANGISERLFHYWMDLGRDGKQEPYASFFSAVTRAKAAAVKNLTARALSGGKGSSQATWFLERRYRSDYGPVQRLEHTGHDGGAIQIAAKAVTEMSDEELLRLADAGTSTSGVGPKGTLPP